jgi:hypothetical protein
MISDFTANLVKYYLCKYTEDFAVLNIDPARRKKVWINKVRFNYEMESWDRGLYGLPWLENDFVLLTPKDMVTRDENWINRTDMIRDFERIPVAIPDAELRGQVSNYFQSVLAKPIKRAPSQRERDEAADLTLISFPQLVDYYIKIKENSGDEARDISAEKVLETKFIFETQVRQLQAILAANTAFYNISGNTYPFVPW